MADLELLPVRNPRMAGGELPARNARADAVEADACWGGRNPTFQSDAQRQWLERMADKGWTVPALAEGIWRRRTFDGRDHGAQAGDDARSRRARRSPASASGCSGPCCSKYATEEQKKHFLPEIVRGEIRWCQGYSEPGAGSDLAGLADQVRGQGRSLADQRPEDLDQLCQQGRLDLLPRPHRPRPRSTRASASCCST